MRTGARAKGGERKREKERRKMVSRLGVERDVRDASGREQEREGERERETRDETNDHDVALYEQLVSDTFS